VAIYDTLGFRDGLPNGWDAAADATGAFADVFRLARGVYHGNACDLPGVLLKYDPFVDLLGHAYRASMVTWEMACYVGHTLRWGTDLGIKSSALRGYSLRGNYKSATGADAPKGVAAFEKRLEEQRTVDLGDWPSIGTAVLSRVFGSWRMAPIGLVAKGDDARIVTDHTASGLNGAYTSTFLKHTIDSLTQLARHLLPGHALSVFDVEGAFKVIPIAPHLWPHMLSKFRLSSPETASGVTSSGRLLMPLAGDFGTAGMPGVFKVFYDCVIGRAWREHSTSSRSRSLCTSTTPRSWEHR
jgi:hypothetical protein